MLAQFLVVAISLSDRLADVIIDLHNTTPHDFSKLEKRKSPYSGQVKN